MLNSRTSGTCALLPLSMLVLTACAVFRSGNGPSVGGSYVPMFPVNNAPRCSAKILGRSQIRDDRPRTTEDLVTREVEMRGGNAAVEVVFEPDHDGPQPPTVLPERYVSFSVAIIDWKQCEKSSR